LYAAALLGGTAIQATPAFAQATRTWVSGVGDDVNPCSRTAPCKTFAGAISKTANGGEINCLDPGGFGAVTINKNLVIDCHYTEGGVLAGGNGIVVNAGVSDVVVLRGLDIFGVNPPTHGVRIIAGGAVLIEDCVIRRFNAANSYGISFQPSGSTNLHVTNTTISQNGAAGSGGGVLMQPTGTGSTHAVFDNVRIQQNNNFGVNMDSTGNTGSGIASVFNAVQISNNANTGLNMNSAVGGAAVLVMLRDSTISYSNGSGISANGVNARARVGNTMIFGNALTSGTGVNVIGGATINTYGDNYVDGNANDGAFTLPAIPKK
jgi:hypothetical protein